MRYISYICTIYYRIIRLARHNDLGKWGERIAVELLVSKGYAIKETNWRMNKLEVDIIAMKADRIVFVEVKTRSSSVVDPLMAIDRTRINHLCRAAAGYIRAYNIPHEYQFDIIIVVGDPASSLPPKVEHIADAFLPPLHTFC